MLAKVIAEPTDTGPPRQPQVPIAHVLLATVAGISKQLLHATDKNKGTGARFKNASLGFPWDIDPPKGASNDEAAKILYDAFRNPLVRRLGLAGAPVVKIVQIFRATADAENRVEELERRTIKPYSNPCLVVAPEKRVCGSTRSIGAFASSSSDGPAIQTKFRAQIGDSRHIRNGNDSGSRSGREAVGRRSASLYPQATD